MKEEQIVDSRQSTVLMKGEECKKIQKMIVQLEGQKEINLENFLDIILEHKLFRQQLFMLKNLFSLHQELVRQMIQWLFKPQAIINRKNIKPNSKSKYYSQPFLCNEFISGNTSFYIEMFNSAKNKQIYFLFAENLDQDEISTSLGYFKSIMIPFVTNDYHPQHSLTLSDSLQECKNCQQSVLSLFSQQLISSLLQLSHIESVFQFLFRLILSSLQDFSVKERATLILIKLYQHISTDDRAFYHMCDFFEQILKNLGKDTSKRGFLIIQLLLQNKLVENSMNRIIKSPLCNLPQNYPIQEKQQEEERVQYHLKIQIFIINLFIKLSKDLNKEPTLEDLNISRNSQTESESNVSRSLSLGNSITLNSIAEKLDLHQKLKGTIAKMMEQLPQIHGLVTGLQTTSLPFSSGQNITPITLLKQVYFQLLLKCLQVARDHPELFLINFDKLDLFPTIQRYLVENSWNNIAQRTLQKIAGILIVNNYNFFRQNNIEKNTVADSFVGFLIQKFTDKIYTFLSFEIRYTNRGYLHTLYKISKAVAFQLNNNHNLIPLINSFEPWKKFILTDLKQYEEKILQKKIPLPENLTHFKDNNQQAVKIEIDQVQTIKILVNKIEIVHAWPVKPRLKRKHLTPKKQQNLDNFKIPNLTPKKNIKFLSIDEQEEFTSEQIQQQQHNNSQHQNHQKQKDRNLKKQTPEQKQQ